MSSTIKIRRNTAAAAAASNPVLAAGELGYETDTGRGKMGDGATAWNSLPYLDRHALDAAIPKSLGSNPGDTLVYSADNGWSVSPVKTFFGTGNPNGAVAAPVGSIFRNTEAGGWNGARVWRKDSGTGANGWVVVDGDTGWRDITGLADPAVLLAGGLRARRVNHEVFIRLLSLSVIAGADQLMVALPQGIKPDHASRFPIAMSSALAHVRFTGDGSNLRVSTPGTVGESIYINYPVTSAWPTTLPGAPA